MFKKYTAAAATLLLTATISAAQGEYATLSASEMGCNPTCNVICGTCCLADTTTQGLYTTFCCNISTCNSICCSDSHCTPTLFPQTTAPAGSTQVPSATQPPSTGEDYTTQSVSAQEQMMANLLAQDRKNNGRTALTLDAELCRIARIKSADMRDKSYFAHESPTYGDIRYMLKHFGYAYSAAGENIAHHANVDKAQAAFMSSQGHRSNILSTAWTKVGIGIVQDSNGYIYTTQIFAR